MTRGRRVKELCGGMLEELNRKEKEAKSRIPEIEILGRYTPLGMVGSRI